MYKSMIILSVAVTLKAFGEVKHCHTSRVLNHGELKSNDE